MADLGRVIEALHRRIAELERRQANMIRVGVVESVDAGAGTVRVTLQDGDQPFVSGDLPWAEISAGAMKTHNPPVSGQQVIMMSATGDLTDAVVTHSLNSNSNARPSSAADVTTLAQIGDVTMTVGSGGLTVAAGGVTVAIGAGGLAVDGGEVTHNGTDVGDTHKHDGVMAGGAVTGTPV